MKTVNIPIADIEVDLSIQPRANGLNQEHADDLAEAYRRGDDVPPIRVYRIGKAYKLAQGFHRLEAAKRAEQADIDCEVVAGTELDCSINALCSNQGHGLKRTNEDKRRCVAEMLKLVPDWTDRRIAEEAGVSNTFVSQMRPQEEGEVSTVDTSPKRTGKGGKTYTAKPKKPVAEKPEPQPPAHTPLNGRTHPSANASDVQAGTPEHDECDAEGEEAAATEGPPEPVPEADPGEVFVADVETLCRDMDKIAARIKAMKATPYAFSIHLDSAASQVEAARKTLWQGRPAHPCPYCRANEQVKPDCRACHGTSRVKKSVYDAGVDAVGGGR